MHIGFSILRLVLQCLYVLTHVDDVHISIVLWSLSSELLGDSAMALARYL